MPVAIAGMHRSGTSMVTRLLNLCGVYLGPPEYLAHAAGDNPEGFWENVKFQKVNEEIITMFGGGWDMPPTFEDRWEYSPHLTDISRDAILAISEISHRPNWGWKDPRNSLTMPFWKKLVPNLKVVICLRNPYEVYRSLTRRGYSSSAFTYNLWLTYYQQLIKTTRLEERVFTHYNSYFCNPQAELRRLLDSLEVQVSDDVINSACQSISTGLRHNQGNIDNLYATNPPDKLLDLYRDLSLYSGHIYGLSLSAGETIFLQHFAPAEESEILALKSKNDLPKIWQQLKNANEEKSRLQREIAELRRTTLKSQFELDQILASRSWRFVQVFQKARLFFIPVGSGQEKNIKAIFNFFRFIFTGKFISGLYRDGQRAVSPFKVRNKKLKNPLFILRKPVAGKKIADKESNKTICIHHRLSGLTSHHFNEAYGFIQEFDRRGRDFHLLISIHASPQIAKELNARRVLDDPTFHMEWSFEERSHRFLDMLHSQIDADLNANDWVLITIATQLEIHALTRWLQELPSDKKPWIVILILSDRWNRSGRDEYERQMAEFRTLKTTLASVSHADAHRLIFFTLTDLLAKELHDLLGTKVDVAPIPLPYGPPEIYTQPKLGSSLPRVAILGGTRREKGSYLIPDIIRACRSQVEVEFLVHLTNNSLTTEEVEKLSHIIDEPQVTIIDKPMSLSEYNIVLNSADIALFPYEIIPYRKRNSGVFAEAVAYGKPVIATRGTWMAEQVEAGRAAGVVFEDLHPDSIARAIAHCVVNLKQLQESAQILSFEWRRKSGIAAFVDFMEEHIALRNAALLPIRKSSQESQIPDCAFVLSVEFGKLESQAILLVESLRQFGGVYSNCPVYAISPRPSRQISHACRTELLALGVQLVVEDLLNADEAYGPLARLAACVWAEKNLTSEIVVSLDNDLFFAGEPDFSLRGVDFFARPVDVKGICTSGKDDPFDEYWQRAARYTGVDYDEIPWVETTTDHAFVKASYNGGMVAVRRGLGLFQHAQEIMRILKKNDLAPRISGENQIFASTGFVGTESTRWWGASQVVLSLAATQLKARISIAPETYNVPAHIAEGLDGRNWLKDAILVHYHWLLNREYVKKDSVIYGGLNLPLPVLEWLKSRTPLAEY
jgi:glycosyltransferase involved in cell wall biosynthesis